MNKMNVVPLECWEEVVEVKEGLGVLWRDGKAIRELPEHLKKMGWPHQKEKKGGHVDAGVQRRGVNGAAKRGRGKVGGGGGGGKPKLRVERDDNDMG